MKDWVIIILYIVLLAWFLSSNFFSNLLLQLNNTINNINYNFLSYIPNEILVVVLLLVSALGIWIITNIKK